MAVPVQAAPRVVDVRVDDTGTVLVTEFASAHPVTAASTRPIPTDYPDRHSCGDVRLIDVGLAAGEVDQRLVQWPAGFEAPFHHTHSVDRDVILAGSVELLLQDSREVAAGVGDVLVVNGVGHGWRAGPQGCTMLVVLTGTSD